MRVAVSWRLVRKRIDEFGVSDNKPVHIVLLATRSPDGRLDGRKVVLNTIISSLKRLGHRVTVVVFSKPPPTNGSAPAEEHPIKQIFIPPPGMARVLVNVVGGFLSGRRSLNECLYFSPRHRANLKQVLADQGCDVVITDMVRLAQYGPSLGLPWIADLDDLLSRRYTAMVQGESDMSAILGYYRDVLPGWVAAPAAMVARALLSREAKTLTKRETALASHADVACLVSPDESLELSKRIDREVLSMPMAVGVPDGNEPDLDKRPLSIVFLGRLDYQANLDAVQHYQTQLGPRLHAVGLGDLRLKLIGSCPDSTRRLLDLRYVEPVGYVTDVYQSLMQHQLFVAPIVSGTGIKTKILEAMACGLPVLTTPAGVKGLRVEGDQHCFIAPDADRFVQHVQDIIAHPDKVKAVARRGQRYVDQHFAPRVLERKWGDVVQRALQRHHNPAQPGVDPQPRPPRVAEA